MMDNNSHITFQEIIDALNNEEQREIILTRLKHEEPLDDEVRGVKSFLEENDYDTNKLKTFLKSSENQFDELLNEQPKNNFNWLKVAAVLVPIIAIGSYFLLFNDNSAKIYATYYEKEAGLPVVMSSGQRKQFNEAMNAFKDDDFEEAKTGFETLLESDADNDTLHYYLACSNMELEELDVAVEQFEQVDSMSVFNEKAEFRIALTNIKMKKIDVAKLELIKMKNSKSHQYQAKAEAILKEIN